MNIPTIINGIAEQLQGTNALIQIQVEDQYYIRIIGDSTRLSGYSHASMVPDTRPFLSWMKEQIEQAPVCENTKVSHRNAHMRLTAFRPDVTFADINHRFLMDYEMHLREHGYSVNTIAKQMRILRRYLNLALDMDIITANPFRKYRIHTQPGHKETLTEKELRKIEDTLPSLPAREQEVAMAFLFATYTGLRFSDLQQVTPSHFKRINRRQWLILQMRKTRSEVRIPVSTIFHGKAVTLSPPFRLHTNAQSNRLLAHALNRSGIRKHVTWHCARHTCATLLLARGVPLPIIQHILGHASITTTQGYSTIKDSTVEHHIRHAFR
jgi:site-specific recombinase XerD